MLKNIIGFAFMFFLLSMSHAIEKNTLNTKNSLENNAKENSFFIEEIRECNFYQAKAPPNEQAVTLSEEWNFWNHLEAEPTLILNQKNIHDYERNLINYEDSNCGQLKAQRTILLKKLINWNKQHVNGFEIKNIGNQFLKYGNIDAIILELKINNKNTYLPSLEIIKERFTQQVNEGVYNELDKQKVNLGITLYEKNNVIETDFKASFIIEIDQKQHGDKWLKISIPAERFLYFSEINYKKNFLSKSELKNYSVNHLVLTAETHSGSVLRKYMPVWSDKNPEFLKEIDVSIKNIYIQYHRN